jgi:2-polyprenyl-3-methyl-5-hydroxy-6-metoxy-1,4-benzoquinol methylase
LGFGLFYLGLLPANKINMTKFLLAIKKLFLLIGIEIRFVKKLKKVSAINLNDVEVVNRAWSDSKIEKLFYSKEVQKLYENIVDVLKKNSLSLTNKKVIDVGCGTGKLLDFLSEKFSGFNATGMEYSSAALDIAKANYSNIRYILHDINNPFPEKFDFVLSTEVLEHILYPDKVLSHLLDMTDNNGALFVSVPNGRIDTFEGHINFWSPESWQFFIENNSKKYKSETGNLGDKNLYAIIINAN